jgi:hypothetical protein
MKGFMVGLDEVRELDWIPENEDEHGWALAPEEILDALLNRPAPLSAVDGVRRAEEVDHE